jgi:hypothetical protein
MNLIAELVNKISKIILKTFGKPFEDILLECAQLQKEFFFS